MKKTKELNNKGITLIALVITIIVMLILVSVTISMAINGGLFEKAGGAVSDTQNAIDKEQTLASGRVQIGGIWYDSIDDYIKGIESENQSGTSTGGEGSGGTMLSYAQTSKDANGFLLENATYESDGYTAVIPKGFKISEVEGENEITKGLVIKDENENEFVWIPVTKELENSYSYAEGYLEPAEVEDDKGKGYDFTTEYKTMVAGVNAKNGFYIGRYETTRTNDYKNIGSKNSDDVLQSKNWYTLYEYQKTAEIVGNGTNIQTAMVYGVLWDEMVAFISQYDPTCDIYHASPDSAVNIKTNNWWETWTQESGADGSRIKRGRGCPDPGIFGRSYSNFKVYYPSGSHSWCYPSSTRMVMYFL